jgi:hypothetical protein
VLDFGLARGEVRPETPEEEVPDSAPTSDELTRGVGTPRYMPPEQTESKALTHAADQYALCVSLREMLRARNADAKPAAVPAWIDAIVRRGTLPDPAQRFESMDALVRALGRDPAVLWRRRLVGGGAVAAAAVAFAIGRTGSNAGVEPCIGGGEDLATIWNPAVRARVVGHVAGLGPYGATEATRLIPAIDGYRDRLTAARKAACMAQERRELTPQLYERNLVCLERSRASYQTVLDVFATVPAERLPDALVALHALPDVDRCLGETRASTVAPPSRVIASEVTRIEGEIAQARVRTVAADPAGPAALEKLATEAERLRYSPLVARAFLMYGFALSRSGKTAEAIPLLDRSAGAALEAGDDVGFVEAYARQVFATVVTPASARPAGLGQPLESLRFAERIANRLDGADGAFVRPLLFNNVGIAHNVNQVPATAAVWFTRARDEWQTTRDPSSELMFIPSNLALVTSDRAKQRELIDESATRFAAGLGARHPFALEFRVRAAMSIHHPGEAAERLREPCTLYHQLHPHLAHKFIHCSYELGWLAAERGDTAAARAAFEAIVATPNDAAGPQVELARIQLAGSAREATAVTATLEQSKEWWIAMFAADGLLVAAAASPRDAIAHLRHAHKILDGITAGRSQPYYQRRLARVRYLLARALGPSAERTQLAKEALAWYRDAGGYERAVAELDALTGSR